MLTLKIAYTEDVLFMYLMTKTGYKYSYRELENKRIKEYAKSWTINVVSALLG